jgi:rhodanese-related sulfurtransferase
MQKRLAALTLNQRLAAVAFLLGAGALFATPTRGGAVSIDPRELALIVEKEVDHVNALDLADWIVAGRADYRLVDLRDANAYGEYHIPSAENIELSALADSTLARNEKVVLYSDGGIHSAQAWFLLRANGFKGVYMLRGGLDAWRDEVLFPALAEGQTPFQAERNARLTALAKHFGGAPRSGAATSADAPAQAVVSMPKLEKPAGAAAPVGARKKKKEGC